MDQPGRKTSGEACPSCAGTPTSSRRHPRIPPQDAPFGNGGFEHGLGFFGTIKQRGPTCATSEPAGETLVYDPSDPLSTRTVCQVRAGVSKRNGIDG